jgi:hypothetical protein
MNSKRAFLIATAVMNLSLARAEPGGPCGCEDIKSMEKSKNEADKMAQCVQEVIRDCYDPKTDDARCPKSVQKMLKRERGCLGVPDDQVHVAGNVGVFGEPEVTSELSDQSCSGIVNATLRHEASHSEYLSFTGMGAVIFGSAVLGNGTKALVRHVAITENEGYLAQSEALEPLINGLKRRCPKEWVGTLTYRKNITQKSSSKYPSSWKDGVRTLTVDVTNNYEAVVQMDMLHNTSDAEVTALLDTDSNDFTDGKVDCHKGGMMKDPVWKPIHQEKGQHLRVEAQGLRAEVAQFGVSIDHSHFKIFATVISPKGAKNELTTDARSSGGCGKNPPPDHKYFPGPADATPAYLKVEGELDPNHPDKLEGTRNIDPPATTFEGMTMTEHTFIQWSFDLEQ